MEGFLFTKANTVLASSGAFHLYSSIDHIFHGGLGLLKLSWFCAVIRDIFMKITVPDVALHAHIKAQGGCFFLAGNDNIG